MKSVSKMGKKERKIFYAQKRGSWDGINPVTRVVQSKKVYSRKREKKPTDI